MSPVMEDEIHLLDYWRIIKRRKWTGAAVFSFVVGLAALYAFLATPIYQGTAQLLVDTEKNQTLNFADGAAVIQKRDPAEFFNTQKEIMTSRLFVDRVVRKLQLDKNPYFIEQKAKALADANGGLHALKRTLAGLLPERAAPLLKVPDPTAAAELDPVLIDIILDNLSSEAPQLSNVMRVMYTAADPGVASAIANGVATALIEYNLALRVKPYQDAAEWLTARLVDSKAKVEESEKLLQRYREGTGVVSFESKESVITQQLQELVTQLVQTEARKQEAQIKYNQLLSVVNSPERLATVPDIMNNIVIQGLRKDELDLQRQLSEISEKFGPKHPQIIRLNSQLETVQTEHHRRSPQDAEHRQDGARDRDEPRGLPARDDRRTEAGRARPLAQGDRFQRHRRRVGEQPAVLRPAAQEAAGGLPLERHQRLEPPGRRLCGPADGAAETAPGALLALAAVLGLFGGLFVAFFVEYMDDTIRTAADVERMLKLPFLDVVPLAGTGGGPLFMASDPKSVVAESFRTIRTGVLLSMVDKPAAGHPRDQRHPQRRQNHRLRQPGVGDGQQRGARPRGRHRPAAPQPPRVVRFRPGARPHQPVDGADDGRGDQGGGRPPRPLRSSRAAPRRRTLRNSWARRG